MTLKRTAEFRKYAGHFVDLTPDYSMSFDEVVRFAAQYLNKNEKIALTGFLDQCLDGTHTDKELHSMWAGSGARIGVEPIGPFFRRLRDDLKAGRL